jgi:hypothetical protein
MKTWPGSTVFWVPGGAPADPEIPRLALYPLR